MGQKMYNVTIQGITKQYPEKIPYSEIVKEYEGSTDAPVMLVIVNGRLRELHKHLKADCEIEFVTSKDPIGHKTYCRSASLILLKAIYDVAGQENIDSLWREIPSGGQNLSGSYFFSRATGPWRGGGLGLPLPLGPPGLCHAVWLGS